MNFFLDLKMTECFELSSYDQKRNKDAILLNSANGTRGMNKVYLCMLSLGIAIVLVFSVPEASAHIVSNFSIKPDPNYADPITHGLLTKDNKTTITISQGSEFILPMILKSEGNGSKMTSYSFHTTYGNDFSAEIMPPGISIDVAPHHLLLKDGDEQKINVIINVTKSAPSGIYSQNIVTRWDNNVTSANDVIPIYFQVGKWNWNSPLNQFKIGTPANNVICAAGFTLVIRTEDGSPACVTPRTAQILIERDWGHLP